MHKTGLWLSALCLLAVASLALTADTVAPAAGAAGNAAAPAHSAITPEHREGGWMQRHDAMNARVKQGDVDLIFIGDSITQGWEGAGKEVWEKSYGKRKAVNLGISGDRTQHVLWRLDHGNIDNIKPKAAVIMIGTNNSNYEDNTVAEIAEGVTAIVQKLRKSLPGTKIMLLAIFPRGERPNPQRGKILQVNQILNKLHDGEHIWFVDFGYKFVEPDGSIPKSLMPDFLHLSPEGYELWAKAIEPKLVKLLGDQ
jgi:beta-glucosidase